MTNQEDFNRMWQEFTESGAFDQKFKNIFINPITQAKDRKQSQWDRMQFSWTPTFSHTNVSFQDGVLLKGISGKVEFGHLHITTRELELYHLAKDALHQPRPSVFLSKENILEFVNWLYIFRQYTPFSE